MLFYNTINKNTQILNVVYLELQCGIGSESSS